MIRATNRSGRKASPEAVAAGPAGAVPGAQAPTFTPAEQRHLAEVVLYAASLQTEERDAYLRESTSGTHPALWAEARRRLASAANLASSFLGQPIGDLFESLPAADEVTGTADAAAVELPPLQPEERYERQAKLGKGGMARVYRAHDRQLRRQVALKLLDHPDRTAHRRFLHEARAQARVHHDNVLEVYETGELDGAPYIAMQYVAGGTLLELRESTSLEEKTRLLCQVAEGLHAAHREGLLHRDVKPSNILVEETPDGRKAWVADFGIAVLEERNRAGRGDLAGTPYFMAPERLRDGAIVDRRTDVYSLGVTMYQLFSGELPFDKTVLSDGLRQILEEEPRPLRDLVPDLPTELAAIVAKCMAKDPEARYASARAVAKDLRRYLDGEVVEAHAATLTYRLIKLALRNRAALTVAGVAAVPLLGLLGALAGLRTVQDRNVMRELSFSHTYWRAAFDEQVTPDDATEKLLRDTLESQRNALGSVHRDVANTLERLGTVLQEKGDHAAAEPFFREALAIWRQLFGSDENADVAISLGNLGGLLHKKGNYDEAEQLQRLSAELLRRLVGEKHPNFANALQDLAVVLISRGEAGEAETLIRRSLQIWSITIPIDHWRYGIVESILGASLTELGRHAEAEALLLPSYRLVRDSKGAAFVKTREVLERLVRLYDAWGKPATAARYRGLLDEARRLAGVS